MLPDEWVDVSEFPDYEVHASGRVRNANRPNTDLRVSADDSGDLTVILHNNDSKTRYLRRVNRLVAIEFCDAPQGATGSRILHQDGDPTNCRADNLVWVE